MLYGVSDIGRNAFGQSSRSWKLRKGEFWAVDDVSFEVRAGETLGIIGSNGSGKTTLLKMLNGIFWPDRGKIAVKGKVGALIEVGAGFHPLLTGRENIYVNAAILGMTRREVEKKFDSILDFAEIGDFIDSPVKHYSSGMFVRLGFAVAVHCEPEILLIDEVLAVGDLSFQNKCMRKLAEIRKNAKSVVFVSHNMESVQVLCDRIALLEKGKLLYIGDTHEAIQRYTSLANDTRYQSMKRETDKMPTMGQHISSGEIIVHKLGVLGNEGNEVNSLREGEDITIFADFEAKRIIPDPNISVAIRDERDFNIIWHKNIDRNIHFKNMQPGTYRLKVTFRSPNLEPNVYRIVFGLKDAETGEYLEKITLDTNVFKITGDRIPRGTVLCESDWKLEQKDQ
jgi:ABC-type polysaccharide/polyol phosphate transport system ATPase subunit